MTYNVLIPDSVHPSALDVFKSTPELQVTTQGQMQRADTLSAIASANALIIRSATKVDAEMLNAAPNLRAIARAGVGVLFSGWASSCWRQREPSCKSP